MSAAGDGTFSARFRGTAEPATYTISTVAALAPPVLKPDDHWSTSRWQRRLPDGQPRQLRRQSGTAGTVPPEQRPDGESGDTADIYAQFGYGHFEPQAIRDYIAHAINNMGVQYVLLVGGDTYDYFDNLGLGSISFVPSLYGSTEPYVTLAPPIRCMSTSMGTGCRMRRSAASRRTSAELDNVIAKTLAYAGQSDQSILLAADDGFSAASASF